jgi:hypothetical protein
MFLEAPRISSQPALWTLLSYWRYWIKVKKKVKLSLQQAVKAHKIVRRRGSHIFWTIDLHMEVRLLALRAGRLLVLISVKRLSRPQAHDTAGRIR